MAKKAVLLSAALWALFVAEPCSVGAQVAVDTTASPPLPDVREPETTTMEEPKNAAADAVILVTLDGVRWQEVFEGIDRARTKEEAMDAPHLWPNVYRLLRERGVALGGGNVPISATGPNFMSLPGYTEILMGHSPVACGDNDCGPVKEPTLVDEILNGGHQAAVVASWERLERAVAKDPRDAFVTTGRNGGTKSAHEGALGRRVAAYQKTKPEPGGGDFRLDRYTGEIGLAVLRERHPTFLMIGLGEPDEYAHGNDYPGYVRSLRACDAFLGELFKVLDAMGERGARTAVFVTADHGRGHDFQNHGGGYVESARTWLLAFGAGIEARGVTQLNEPRHLADIAPTMRTLLGMPADHHPYAGHSLDEIRRPRIALLP